MSKAQQASYSFRFYGRGGFIPASKLRYASKFSILRNGKTILPAHEFPRNKVKAEVRRKYLHSLIVQIERARQKILAKRRAKYRMAREFEGKKKFHRRVRRQLNKPIKLSVEDKEYLRESHATKVQRLVFEKTVSIDEEIIRSADAVRDAIVIPIAPDGKKYTKQIIDKMMRKPDIGDYHLAVMDLTLDEDQFIPMTIDTFTESYSEAVSKMLPSVMDYFEQTRRSSRYYILRIKFLNNWDPLAPYENYGISYMRIEASEKKQIQNLFRHTFFQLLGPRDPYDKTTRGRLRANYLMGEKLIYITGISLEAMDMI